MAHGIVNTTHMACWNIDALNEIGVYSDADLDNGTFVTLVNISKDSDSNITGYQYVVTPAAAAATNVFLVATPEVGRTLEMQIHDDIRDFYNVKGQPMDIKGILAGVDCIELDATAFGGTLPTKSDVGKYYPIATGGKLGTAVQTAPTSGAYFRLEGLHSIECGADVVPTAIIRCMKNN